MKKLLNDPKTTLGAVVILAATAMFLFKKIDVDAYVVVLGIAGSWIGFTSKDAKKNTHENNQP